MTRSTPASTYDEDFYAWTQEQAAALRAMPAPGADVDIAHVAEEIEDLGKRDLREVVSYLERLFEHLIKIASASDSRDVPHWRTETRHFARSAKRAFSPGMRRLINLSEIWRQAHDNATADAADLGLRITVPVDCPFALDDLLVDVFDLDAAQARLTASPKAKRGDE